MKYTKRRRNDFNGNQLGHRLRWRQLQRVAPPLHRLERQQHREGAPKAELPTLRRARTAAKVDSPGLHGQRGALLASTQLSGGEFAVDLAACVRACPAARRAREAPETP